MVSSYLYRAFYALPPLTTSTGEQTGALYGVLGMLRKLVEDYQPACLAVVFDAPGKTFRHDLYAAYKAHRPPMPEELRCQIEPLHATIRALGLPLLEITGVEADDVIGTLARQAIRQGLRVVIASGDKDLAQLVNDRITLVDTMKNTLLDAAGVEEKFGVPPELMADYLALVGDSADNVPGVPGVGPKTAARWLRQYGSLDALVTRSAEIAGVMGEKLRAGLAQLPLSHQLVILDCEVELPFTPKQLRRTAPDRATLRELFSRYEFRSWLRQLDESESESGPPAQPVPTDAPGATAAQTTVAATSRHQQELPSAAHRGTAYQTVLNEAALDGWLERLRQAQLFAFDTETTSLDYMEAQIVGVSFAVSPGEAAYVPLAHDYTDAPQQLNREEVLERLRPLLEDPATAKLGQNLKYDLHVLENHGIKLAGIRHDTMLESYVLDSTATRHDMDGMAEHYLDLKTIHFEDIAGKGARQLTFNQVSLEQAGPYAAEDADVTLRLHHYFWPRLTQEPALQRVYEEIEIPLLPVLARLERNGVKVDADQLRRQSKELEQRLRELEQQACALAGESFNPGSTKQLQTILFDKLRLPVARKTPKGQPSTAEDVLQELALDFPLPKLILEHRGLSKLKSTYTDRLPREINPRTGRVHTSYHQAVASTGRLASADPNLQQIPVRTPEGRRIRQAFVAPPGYRIVAADYSQIELRILAHLSQDEGLLRAFAQGEDIHRFTAAEVFGVPLDAVDEQQRRAAKTINFGLIYGMSAFGLARQLGIERRAAQVYMDRYFARYPRVRVFMEEIRQQAADRGYVATVLGRRLYVPDIRAQHQQRRQAAERTAINAPMQGTAADIIKLAMLAVDSWLKTSGVDARMIMQVHDELVFEVADSVVETAAKGIRAHMVAAAALRAPLEVDIGVGGNWDEAH